MVKLTLMADIESSEENPTNNIPCPPRCEGCAIQCNLRTRLSSMMAQKSMSENIGIKMMGEGEGIFDALIDSRVPEEDAEIAKLQSRQQIGLQIDFFDKIINTTQEEIDLTALSCRGVRQVQFTESGVNYMINICTSDRVNSRDLGVPLHIPTHIQTDTL